MKHRVSDRAVTREERAWRMAQEYAKDKAATLYPDKERREREEKVIAREEYRKLMYP